MNYVLVATLSNECRHCLAFKQTELDKIKKGISNRFRDVELIIDDRSKGGFSSNIPAQLQNFIGFLPHISLFTKKKWNSLRMNLNEEIDCVVFNGEIKNGKTNVLLDPNFKQRTAETILNWIAHNISNNPVLREKQGESNMMKKEETRTIIVKNKPEDGNNDFCSTVNKYVNYVPKTRYIL